MTLILDWIRGATSALKWAYAGAWTQQVIWAGLAKWRHGPDRQNQRPMDLTTTTLNFSVSLCESTDALASEWQDLEARSDASFFLSWSWIGSLVEVSIGTIYVVRALDHSGRTQAIGLLMSGQRQGRLRQTVNAIHLNESSDPELDSIYIEANGFLTARGLPQGIPARMLAAVASKQVHPKAEVRWDELKLAGVPESWLDFMAQRGLSINVSNRQGSAFIDLREARARGGCLSIASAGVRRKIRRSMQLYSERGPLKCENAKDVTEALEWLSELKRFHQIAWQNRGHSGAFACSKFEAFHRAMIVRSIQDGRVEILRVSAGAYAIGYLYDFISGRWTGNYQSGFLFEDDNRLKPGLVSFILAAERRSQLGSDVYDFLAGDSRYKLELGRPGPRFVWVELRRFRLLYRIEDVLRAGRQILQKFA